MYVNYFKFNKETGTYDCHWSMTINEFTRMFQNPIYKDIFTLGHLTIENKDTGDIIKFIITNHPVFNNIEDN